MERKRQTGSLSDALENWIPVRLKKEAAGPVCEWLFTGDKPFTEPFFDETIAACRYAAAHNRRYQVLSGLEMLEQWAENRPFLPPSAVIFHVSRCGSTLLSQLLAEDSRNLVLSEVPFLDELLRLPLQQQNLSRAVAESYFRAALAFYGRSRQDGQQHLFIKTDSWHLHFYEHYRKCFPGIPFFLLFRHPLEVIRSQQKQRGIQSVPGLLEPELFGFSQKQATQTNLDHYMANVLASYYQKMLWIVENDPLAFPLDYKAGMATISTTVYARLNQSLEGELAERFARRCRFHAKRPDEPFRGEKQPAERPAFLQPAFEQYHRLATFSTTAVAKP